MPRNLKQRRENSLGVDFLERLSNDRILSRYVSTVGYSSLSSVQDCLRYQNQVHQSSGQEIALTDLLNARNSMTPTVAMRARRGFRA